VWQWQANPPEVERADEWNDKVDVTTRAFLGLTVACARCQDHKYDPIPQKDYYRFAGVFASSQFHPYPLVSKGVVDDFESKKKTLDQKEKDLAKFLTDASQLHASTLFARTEEYMLAAWRLGVNSKLTVVGVAEEKHLDATVLERWVVFLKKPPNNYSYLKAWQEMVSRGGTEEEAKKLASEFYAAAVEINAQHEKIVQENALITAKNSNPENEKYDPLPNGTRRRLTKDQFELKSLDREQMYLWKDMFEEDQPDFPAAVDNMVNPKRPPGLFKFEGAELERRLSPEWTAYIKGRRDDIEAFKKAMPSPYPFIYGIREHPEPVDLKVFLRGSPFNLGDDAPKAFLALLSDGEPKPFEKGSGRLELAEQIVKQPLAHRVIVNRIWRWHMGSGIVNTPSNFGQMGERPSNPDLLDYLTSEFVANGMSWKKLHKQIVMSRTYQLSSVLAGNPAMAANEAKDEDNRLYWRGNRRRLEAEGLWDLLLSASGKLDVSKIDGPSEEFDEKMTHRAVFGKVSRMIPNPFQLIWDFPNAGLSSEGRYNTNVPLQRLFFLNSDIVYDRAAALAERASAAGNFEEQVRKAYQLVYQREPLPSELAAIEKLLAQPLANDRAPSSSNKPDSVSTGPVPGAAVEPRKSSPLKSVSWTLLSSNEFLFID
jgi:hypothetical protein